jgi:hypothetical protein
MDFSNPLVAAVVSKETLFALSLFPYLGFLWFITKSHQTPKIALAGFYFLLVFVVVTIPAGLYAEQHYHLELANVDWLHGWAESLLSVSNIMVVIGFTLAIANLKKTT